MLGISKQSYRREVAAEITKQFRELGFRSPNYKYLTTLIKRCIFAEATTPYEWTVLNVSAFASQKSLASLELGCLSDTTYGLDKKIFSPLSERQPNFPSFFTTVING